MRCCLVKRIRDGGHVGALRSVPTGLPGDRDSVRFPQPVNRERARTNLVPDPDLVGAAALRDADRRGTGRDQVLDRGLSLKHGDRLRAVKVKLSGHCEEIATIGPTVEYSRMTLHRAVAHAVEIALPEHGDLSEVIAISDHRLGDDLLDLSLPDTPFTDV